MRRTRRLPRDEVGLPSGAPIVTPARGRRPAAGQAHAASAAFLMADSVAWMPALAVSSRLAISASALSP